MPSGPMLRTHERHRPPHATGLSFGKRLENRTETAQTDAGLVEEPTT